MTSFYHYAGHIISQSDSGRFPESNLVNIQQVIEKHLQENKTSNAYGSLAAGADILFAENFLKQGARLHIVLPFNKKRFTKLSVSSSGTQWLDKFQTLLDNATTITQIFYLDNFDEELSFALCTEIAIGLGLAETPIESQNSKQLAQQITLWDQQSTTGIAGTFPDMLRMQATGLKSTSISSKKPFNTQSFHCDKKVKIQSLNLIMVLSDNNRTTLQLESVKDLVKQLAKIPFNAIIRIDLNPSIYGAVDDNRANNKAAHTISNRALGHICYHSYVKLNSLDRTHLLNNISKIRHQTKTKESKS